MVHKFFCKYLIDVLMNFRMKRYRIARVSFTDYEFQQWSLWFPFWFPMASHSKIKINELAGSVVN